MSPAPAAAVVGMSDEELARRFTGAGDRDALGELVARYSPRLRRLLISLLGPDPETVADAEQEVYVALIRRLERFRGDSSFATFFYALARNRTLDLMRSRRRVLGRTSPMEDPDLFTARDGSPEAATMGESDAELVRRALRRLSPQDQFLVYMKDAEDERIERLAAMAGMKVGTVKSRLARARTKLAAYLQEMGYERS